MNNAKIKLKGIVLFLVLGTILMAIVLANIILTIISNQARLTGHQLGRIQAYYASMAGINLAYERLMNGIWPVPAAGAHNEYAICRESPAARPVPGGAACVVTDGAFPGTAAYILISVMGTNTAAFNLGAIPNQVSFPACPPTVPAGSGCINAATNFTATF
jgi:hypothetical protein